MGLAEIVLHTGRSYSSVSSYYLQDSLWAERRDVDLACRKCTKMSLKDSVLLYAMMWWFGEMLRICGSFPMICYRSYIDYRKHLHSMKYRITIRRTVLGPDALRVSGEGFHGSGGWFLEMLQGMIAKEFYLARRDIVRESTSFCSRLSSAMRAWT